MLNTTISGSMLTLATALGCLSCASGPKKEARAPGVRLYEEVEDAPKWFKGDCQDAVPRGSWLCGVGTAIDVEDPGHARVVAEDQARAALAKQIDDWISQESRQHKEVVTANAGTDREQHLEDTLVASVEGRVPGARVHEVKVTRMGTMYALVIMNSEQLKNLLAGLQNLPPDVRAGVERRAEEAYGRRRAAAEQAAVSPGE